MHWYNFLAAFFSGLFLANTIPHYVKGVCGDRFPTPFSTPSGKGLSSPIVNTLWALLNMVFGFILFRRANVASGNLPLLVFFLGVAAISIQASLHFAHKHAN
jgi:hypothetical protein